MLSFWLGNFFFYWAETRFGEDWRYLETTDSVFLFYFRHFIELFAAWWSQWCCNHKLEAWAVRAVPHRLVFAVLRCIFSPWWLRSEHLGLVPFSQARLHLCGLSLVWWLLTLSLWNDELFIYLFILMVGLNQSCFSGVLYRQTVFFFSILFFPLCLFITSFFNHIKAHFKSVGGCTMTLSWDCRIFVPFLKKIPSNHSLTLSYVSLVCCFFINFPT